MKKIISLFQRNYDGDHLVRDEVVPGAEWVLRREGTATIKWDGTACLVRDGRLFKRYDAKHGKTPPPNFEPTQDPDPVTGHWPGWLPVGDGPEDKWHREAFERGVDKSGNPFISGQTYELCGPKISGNPEGFDVHVLVRHGDGRFVYWPTNFEELKHYLSHYDSEGIVWHHPDGRMVKIKGRDFGIRRKSK